MDEFYLQDKRSYVGNDLLFWAKDGKGYTTDLRKAHIYTKEEAFNQNLDRETDIPWPKAYIDSKVRPAVDCQHVDIDIALAGVGEKLREPPKPRKQVYQCWACGKFISLDGFYGDCPHCDADNRP